MSTTTIAPSSTKATTLAASAKFKTFALTFAMSFPVLYVVCDFWNLPLFTFHPATNRVDLGWAAARSGEGPAMYWYGWTATCLVGSAILGALATFLSEAWFRLATIWFIPALVAALTVWEAARTGGKVLQMWQTWALLAVVFGLALWATSQRERIGAKLPLLLSWLLYIVAVPFLFISLRPFWEKGGWW